MKLFLSVLILFFALNSFGSGNHAFDKTWTMIAGIKVKNMKRGFKALSQMGIDIAGVSHKSKIIDVLISHHDYIDLVNKGYDVEVSDTKGVTARPDEEYKNPAETEEILKEYNSKYPSISKLVSIGKSLEGRDIWAIKITKDSDLKSTLKPVVLFNSMHHAREIMTPEVSIDIIDYLLSNYGHKSDVTNWLDTTVVWVIPMFNVDGNNKMWNEDKFWRKNARNGYGVDLNRNYPTGWGSCNGSSGRKNAQDYRGPSPASEPETRAMMNFIERTRPVFDISYHAYSQLVIYPYGCADRKTQTKEVVEKIGKHLGSLLDYKAGTAWELLYNADGGDIDWMYEAYQVIPFVLELNSRIQGFHPDYSRWRNKTVKRNRVGWQYLIKRAHESGIRGVVKENDNPVNNYKLKVYKKSMFGKRTIFQTYNGQLNGVYHLVLNPGKYSIDVVVDGEVKKTVETNVKASLVRMNILI